MSLRLSPRRERMADAMDARTPYLGPDDPAWSGQTVAELLVSRFRLSPGDLAVTDGEQTISYADLDRRSEALARHLLELGAGPDRLVAVYLERSVELVAAIVAVIRSGAAYLPLSTEDPPARLSGILADAQPAAVITAVRPQWLEATGAHLVRPGAAARTSADAGQEGALDLAAPRDLAYVIYTSGSTGRPKGVLTEHRAIANRLCWMQEAFQLEPGDNVMQKTPYTFDVSVWEFFWPLLAGARLVLARPGGHRDPRYIADVIERQRISVIHFVPSMLREFLRQADPRKCRSLRQVMASGEALTPGLRRRFFALLPWAELHNLYGPTEAAVDVTHWPCSAGEGADSAVPIGHPIRGISAYILDSGLRPADPGQIGELCIGGIGVARGYLNRPELTAERFVPDPFSHMPGARMYRTGDLARLRSDGALEYHGRLDDQVKVAGVRIELGEVEAALESLDGVSQAAAAVRGSEGEGGARLVGYVAVPRNPDAATLAAWRRSLSAVLPPAAIPALLIPVTGIPMTAHGKADRSLLPWPPPTAPGSAAGDHPPPDDDRDPVQAAWLDALGPGGAVPDFFAAGGTSLQAMMLLDSVRSRAGADVPLPEFFADPTITGLRKAVAASRAATDAITITGRCDHDGPPSLSPAQERFWFLQQLEPESLAMISPTALRLRGKADPVVIQRCLDALRDRHRMLRTRFAAADGIPVAEVESGSRSPLPFTVLHGLSEHERDRTSEQLIAESAAVPFDLAKAPPLRCSLVRFALDDHLLVLTPHHILVDGWSWSVMVREFAADWEQVAAGREPAGPRATGSAAWPRGTEYNPALRLAAQRARQYWRSVLAGAPEGVALPVDGARPPGLSMTAASVPVRWAEGFDRRLEDFCRRERVTPYMTLLALFGLWLGRLSGQEDLVVASPYADRSAPGAKDLVGCLLTTSPHRLTVAEDTAFIGLLRQARESALAGHSHARVPIEQIVADLNPRRETGRLPVFQHLLVVQNVPSWTASTSAGKATVVQLPASQTHYDIKLEVFPGEPGIRTRMVYAAELFLPGRAGTMARSLAALADQALADPDQRVTDYTLATHPLLTRLGR